jgi:hypothetical protein
LAKLDNVKVVAASIEHGGNTYSKVNRGIRVDDIIKVISSSSGFFTEAAFYPVVADGEDGKPGVYTDNFGIVTSGWVTTFEVYEKVTDKPARLTIGDYAKVAQNTNNHNYDIGSVVKIVQDDRDSCPYKGERADGTRGNYLYEADVERATEAEFNGQKAPVEAAAPTSLPVSYVIHDGRVYVKEAREAKAGELVIVTDTSGHYIKLGEVVTAKSARIIEGSRGQFSDSRFDGDTQSVDASNYRVIVPTDSVTIGGALYTLESRKANVGETVLVIRAVLAGGKYGNRDIITVNNVDGDYDAILNGRYAVSSEYVVLAKTQPKPSEVTAPTTPTYREVKRTANVGDRIKIVDRWSNEHRYSNGDIGTVIKPWGLPDVKADFNGKVYGVLGREYVVLEAIVSIVEPPQPKRLAIGEYAVVQRGAVGHISNYVGKIVQVTVNDAGSGAPYIVSTLGGERIGLAYKRELVRATDAEVAEAKRALRIPVGAYVRIAEGSIGDICKHIGEIVVVTGNGRPYQLRTDDGVALGPAYDHEITQVSAEEVAQYKAEAAVSAKWAAIGRRVNEYKAGDIVEITRSQCGDKVGTVTEVIGTTSDTQLRVKSLTGGGGSYLADTDVIKLVTPVEQRFDRSAA